MASSWSELEGKLDAALARADAGRTPAQEIATLRQKIEAEKRFIEAQRKKGSQPWGGDLEKMTARLRELEGGARADAKAPAATTARARKQGLDLREEGGQFVVYRGGRQLASDANAGQAVDKAERIIWQEAEAIKYKKLTGG